MPSLNVPELPSVQLEIGVERPVDDKAEVAMASSPAFLSLPIRTLIVTSAMPSRPLMAASRIVAARDRPG
jgi:hypothetical protein